MYYEWLPLRWFSLVPEISLAMHYESAEYRDEIEKAYYLLLAPGMSLRLNYKKYYLYGKLSILSGTNNPMFGLGLGYRLAENMNFELGFTYDEVGHYCVEGNGYSSCESYVSQGIAIRVLIPF